MNEALRVKRMELADVFDKLRIERDRLDAAIKEYDEKQKVLIPLEIRLKRQREEFKDLRERIKTMEASLITFLYIILSVESRGGTETRAWLGWSPCSYSFLHSSRDHTSPPQ